MTYTDLEAIIRQSKISNAALARACKLPPQITHQWLAGKRPIPREHMHTALEVCGYKIRLEVIEPPTDALWLVWQERLLAYPNLELRREHGAFVVLDHGPPLRRWEYGTMQNAAKGLGSVINKIDRLRRRADYDRARGR